MALKFLALGALVLVQLLTSEVEATSSPKTVCYYESWVHWRHGDGKQDPSELDYHLCTHLVYAYMGIDSSSHEIKLLDPYLMNDLHDLDKFSKAKGSSKAIVSVGGASQSTQFAYTADSDQHRTAFVKSVVNFLAKYNFDGIIIDWYGMQEKDGENLVKLLDKFDELFAQTPYTLAITLPVTQATLNYYNVPKISQYVDFINVITYDYSGSWAKQVGHASPISLQLGTLEEYHKRGAPRSKLLMSVPLYARTWKLANPTKQDLGDEASGPGSAGPYTQVEGQLSYNELCVMIKNSPTSFSIIRDPKEHAVHAIYMHGSHAEFITFEDTKTLGSKAKNITEQGYAGMTVYTMSNEDVHGTCGKKFPLLNAINDNYYRGATTENHVPTIAPVTKPAHPVDPFTKDPNFHCTKVGKFRDHMFCFKYYQCEASDFGGFEQVVLHCERHQAWDETHQQCVDAKTVPGCH